MEAARRLEKSTVWMNKFRERRELHKTRITEDVALRFKPRIDKINETLKNMVELTGKTSWPDLEEAHKNVNEEMAQAVKDVEKQDGKAELIEAHFAKFLKMMETSDDSFRIEMSNDELAAPTTQEIIRTTKLNGIVSSIAVQEIRDRDDVTGWLYLGIDLDLLGELSGFDAVKRLLSRQMNEDEYTLILRGENYFAKYFIFPEIKPKQSAPASTDIPAIKPSKAAPAYTSVPEAKSVEASESDIIIQQAADEAPVAAADEPESTEVSELNIITQQANAMVDQDGDNQRAMSFLNEQKERLSGLGLKKEEFDAISKRIQAKGRKLKVFKSLERDLAAGETNEETARSTLTAFGATEQEINSLLDKYKK